MAKTMRGQIADLTREVDRLKVENAAYLRQLKRLHFYEELFERMKGCGIESKFVDELIGAVLAGRHMKPREAA